jgi:hypothetical protein
MGSAVPFAPRIRIGWMRVGRSWPKRSMLLARAPRRGRTTRQRPSRPARRRRARATSRAPDDPAGPRELGGSLA